jgi:ubiquitin-protein ligase E3 C
LADLAALDAELYKGLMIVKNYTGDLSDLALTFSITEEEFGVTKSVDLRYNGSNVAVDQTNVIEYVYKVADYHLNRKMRTAARQFQYGLEEMVDPRWTRLFNTSELQLLLSGTRAQLIVLHKLFVASYSSLLGGMIGSHADIDVEDWAKHTVYDQCNASTSVVKWFWQVVGGMSPAEKQAVLRFATSCSRPPLMGFRYLQPPFTIRLIADAGARVSPSLSYLLLGMY